MKLPRLLSPLICAAIVFGSLVIASAQVGIGGVTDKTVYLDQVTFTIANEAGFIYDARLDGFPVPVGLAVPVTNVDYQELSVFRTNVASSAVTSQLVRFIVSASERNHSEDGLPPWTPHPVIPSAPAEFAGAQLRLVTPRSFPTNYPAPVVVWVENTQGHAVRVNGALEAPGRPSIAIRRGVGSGFLLATNPAGLLSYTARVASLETSRVIEIEAATTWTAVAGTLTANAVWPPGSRIHVTGTLTNPVGGTLTVGAGTVVRLNPSADVHNFGRISIEGTVDNPVVFMPAVTGQPWGGFVQHADNTDLTATGAIFTGSGANQGCWFTGHGCSSSVSGISSHRSEQALVSLKGADCNLSLTDSAAFDLAGQLGHSAAGVSGSYRITLTRFLVQRCTTGGEYTDAAFNVNDSAFIECPLDTAEFVDGDNDGLYLVNGTHGFTNSLWGWAKDDGVDSGASGAGVLNFHGCWFESIFHEANALSGSGKNVTHYQSVFLDCGQGLEVGYDGPFGTIVNCLASGNLTGVRFGDNYPWTYVGFLRVTNSFLLNNYRDVWGMNWQDWTYRTSAMDVRSNSLTVPNPAHPDNTVWQPAVDGWRLAAFLTTQADASVGLGFGLSTSQIGMEPLTQGLPICLSSFTTNSVSVDFVIEAPGQTLASATVEFLPGEIVKLIPPFLPPSGLDLVRVKIHKPVRAAITGLSQVWASGSPVPNRVLQLLRFGQDWTLVWTDPDARLEQADSLLGPWSSTSATSPTVLNNANARQFFRLVKP